MNSKVKDVLQMVGTSALVIGVTMSPFLYTELKQLYPSHKVGTCLKFSLNEGNEFEKPEYQYILIEKVGKYRYKYAELMRLSDGEWHVFHENATFFHIDSGLDAKVIDCSEMKAILDKTISTKEEENE